MEARGHRLVTECPACGRDAAGARYCEHCGAPVMSPLPDQSLVLDENTASGPFRIEIDAARVLQQGAAGVLELRLTNRGTAAMSMAMVEIETPVAGAPLRSLVRDVAAGRHVPVRFSVVPMRHGEAVCRVRVKGLDAAQVFTVSTGEFTVTINPARTEETTLQFIVENSDVVGDFENVFTQKRPRPRGVMHPRRRAAWVPIRLVECERREVRPVLKHVVLPPGERGVSFVESAAFRWLDTDDVRTVALFAKDSLALGRSALVDPNTRDHNNVVLRLMPETTATRELSRRIHRYAFRVEVSADAVRVARLGRRDGRVVIESSGPLDEGEPLDVAGLFDLSARIVRGQDHLRWPAFSTNRGSGRPPEIELTELRVPGAEQVLGVVLSRSDDAAAREQYVIVRRHVTVGASPDAAVLIAQPGVAPVHARLIAKGGLFFIEDLGSDEGTWLNERRLHADETALLQHSDHITLGRTTVAFEPFTQQFGDGDT
ncbi:MAG: FHA domain-containing protein [Verrucomicrobia bacterium]|nr:FHA domain-containing protein [Verrucomicrobiota bacterium]